MSARHRNLSGELTTPSIEPVRPGRTRRAPRPAETGTSRAASTPPAQRRGTGPRGIAMPVGSPDPRGIATSCDAGTSSGTVTYRGATDPRGAARPRGSTPSRGSTLPRGINASRGGAPRPPMPSTRTPFLLRATLATALLAAVGASMMRAHVDVGAVAGDALRLKPVTHSGASADPQVVHLVPAGSQPAHGTAATVRPAAGAAGGLTAAPNAAKPDQKTVKAGRGARCQVRYVLTPQADGRSSVVVTVNNLGSASIDGWVVRWPAPADQELALGWGAGLARAGSDAIATDAGFNRLIPVKGRVSFGFSGWNLQTTPSTAFTVNGVMCK
jgi:hypothetical protein